MDFLAATNKAAVSGCPADFDADNWNQVTPSGLIPKPFPNTSGMSSSESPHGEEGKRRNHWAVALQHQGQNTNVYPKSGTFPPCQRVGSPQAMACGAIAVAGAPSCVTATSLRGHTPFTPDHCWHTCLARGFEQVRKGKGPRVVINKAAKLTCCLTLRSLSLCPKNKWKNVYAVHLLTWTAFTCPTETGTGCEGWRSSGTKKEEGSQKQLGLMKPICVHTNV